jgi:hypothetical protein
MQFVGSPADAQPIERLAVDLITGRCLARPTNDMTFAGFHFHRALPLAVPHHIFGRLVAAKNLQGRDQRTLATVVRADEHGESSRRFDHRVAVRHEILQLDARQHSRLLCGWIRRGRH